jgi:hypothetical protein
MPGQLRGDNIDIRTGERRPCSEDWCRPAGVREAEQAHARVFGRSSDAWSS